MLRLMSLLCGLAVWALAITDKSVTQISNDQLKSVAKESRGSKGNCGIGGACVAVKHASNSEKQSTLNG